MPSDSSNRPLGFQFSLRSLLVFTLIAGLDFAVIARARGSLSVMNHIILVQAGLLFICWLLYRYFHVSRSENRKSNRGGLFQGLAAAGVIYGGILYTLLIAWSAPTTTPASQETSFEIFTMLLIVPMICLIIAILGSDCTTVAGAIVCSVLYSVLGPYLDQFSEGVHASIVGCVTGAVFSGVIMMVLTLGDFVSESNVVWAVAGVALPAIMGSVVCYLFSRMPN